MLTLLDRANHLPAESHPTSAVQIIQLRHSALVDVLGDSVNVP